MFKYELEDPKDLVRRLMDYSIRSRKDGILDIENDVLNDKNEMVKTCLCLVVDGVDSDLINEINKPLIKYYTKDLKCKKEQTKRQLKLILCAALSIHGGVAPRSLENILVNFYPLIEFGDYFDYRAQKELQDFNNNGDEIVVIGGN